MTDLHVKGAINSAKDTIKEAVGRLTGDRKLEAEGKVRGAQGTVQTSLGDAADAIHDADRETTPDASHRGDAA